MACLSARAWRVQLAIQLTLRGQVGDDDAERTQNACAEPPSQRARMRFLEKSSVLEFSDHCTPMPGVGVDHHGVVARTWPVPAAS